MKDFLKEVEKEIKRARKLFPGNNATFLALTEEFGEVAKALLDEPWMDVRTECVQLAAMAMRLAEEGDSTLKEIRAKNVHEVDGDHVARYALRKHIMPGQFE